MRKHWVLIASGKACSIEGPWRDWFIPLGRGYSVGAETSWNHEASRSSFMDFLWIFDGWSSFMVVFSIFQLLLSAVSRVQRCTAEERKSTSMPRQCTRLYLFNTCIGGDDLMMAICGNGIAKSLHGFCQDCSSTGYKMVKGFQPHRMASIICGCRMYIVYNSIDMYTVTRYCWQLVWPGRESLYASFASAEAMTCWYILTVASLHVGHLPLFRLDVESRRSVYSICLWKIWKQLRSKAWAFQVFAICLTVLPCVWDSGCLRHV